MDNRDEFAGSICVVGPGAIGITIAARLSLAGLAPNLVARGESVGFIKRNGIRLFDLEGEHHSHVSVGRAGDFGPQDVVFLCPKSQDMPEMAKDIQPLIAEHTMIVPLINGIPWWYFDGEGDRWRGFDITSVDPDHAIKKLIPSRQVIGTTTMIAAERLRVGTARTIHPMHLTIGELNDHPSKRLEDLAGILRRSGIDVRVASRIRDAVWTKVVRNLISNPVTAITGATLGENFGDKHLAAISRQMLHEVLPVIAAYGSKLELDPDEILESGRRLGEVKTSMLQDLERGNPLELAAICDAVLELADRRGIDLPIVRAITGIAHFKSRDRRRDVA